ncbi:MAG: helix-turn-helix domain-containing protein [Spirochaetaceae bacterium]|jgi:AraC family cel operon transcriptional repressor|nr:helix-turn-helix domain-containing protein [Spirochaetaceae bacterium]
MSIKIFQWKDRLKKEYLINSFTVESGYNFPLHTHKNQWEIVYCEEGSFDHEVNGIKHKQVEGEFIFIRETDTHKLNGKSFKYHNIAFSGAWMDALCDFLGEEIINQTIIRSGHPPYYRIPGKEKHAFEEKIRGLLSDSKDSYKNVEFSHFIISILDLYMINKEEKVISDNIPLWFQEIIRMIHQRAEGIPTLDEIINRSCKCAEHVSRSFKKYLGLTPSQYLKGIKLKKAAELLRNTNYPIKEICYLSFYENANYFHKQFREIYDQTPSEYRKSFSQYIH